MGFKPNDPKENEKKVAYLALKQPEMCKYVY
jgi:hypothetical protein